MRYFDGDNEYDLGRRNIINSSLKVRKYSISFSDDMTCGDSWKTGGRSDSNLQYEDQ